MFEIKSFPFPVLSPDVADYEKGEYTPKVKPRERGSKAVEIHHAFSGGGLIGELLKKEQAAFGCVVSLPSTMYRRVHVAPSAEMHGEKISCVQTLEYGDSGYGQSGATVASPLFRPIVLAREDVKKTAHAPTDGLMSLWDGAPITIRKGSVIAYGEWSRFGGIYGGMFFLRLDEGLNDWQMRVSPDTTSADFRFSLRAGRKLFHRISSPKISDERQRKSVLTHAVSAALSLLKQEYNSPDSYAEHINLRFFADLLRDKDLGDWCDPDFRPEEAATALYPHVFSGKEEDDD